MAVKAVIYQQYMKVEIPKYTAIPWEYDYEDPIPGQIARLVPRRSHIIRMLSNNHSLLEELIREHNKTDTLVFILTKSGCQVKDFNEFLSTRPWVDVTCHTPLGVTNSSHPERPNNMFLYTVKGAKE